MAFPNPPAFLTERTLHSEDLSSNRDEALLHIYAWMQLSRATDNRLLELYRQGLITGTVTGGHGNAGHIVPLALCAE